MAATDLTEDERVALIHLLTLEIERDRYPLSPRIQRLKSIREKLGAAAPPDAAPGRPARRAPRR